MSTLRFLPRLKTGVNNEVGRKVLKRLNSTIKGLGTLGLVAGQWSERSVDAKDAISGTHLYAFEFNYTEYGVAIIRYSSESEARNIVDVYSGPAAPGPVAPNVNGLVNYVVYKLNKVQSQGVVFDTRDVDVSRWQFAIAGQGGNHGYSRAHGANNPNYSWGDASFGGTYTFISSRVFTNGGVTALMRGDYGSGIDNDSPTRSNVVLMTGAGGGGGATGGGPTGGSGNIFDPMCGAAGGAGGTQSGGGSGGPGNPGGNPGSGFAGGPVRFGQPQGSGGPAGFDGWYGGGSGGYDRGACTGGGYGGGGSGRADPQYVRSSPQSYTAPFPGSSANNDWWWIGNAVGYGSNGVLCGYNTSNTF